MVRFVTDEDFNNNILRGMLRRQPELDRVRVQDVALAGAKDPDILAWAAEEERILLTHDVSTMTRHAYDRVTRGLPMPGGFEVHRSAAMGTVIDDLLLLAESSEEKEWEGQILYIPLS